MYYEIESDEAAMSAFITPERESAGSLIQGRAMDPTEADPPFRYSYRDPTGAPLQDYYSAHSLMSRSLLAALVGAGVDNLQPFDAELVDEATGLVRVDFACVNIIGMIACADLRRSTTSELGSSDYFHDLVIDARKAHDLLMFRVAESMINVLLHDTVVDALLGRGLGGIVLTPVRESP